MPTPIEKLLAQLFGLSLPPTVDVLPGAGPGLPRPALAPPGTTAPSYLPPVAPPSTPAPLFPPPPHALLPDAPGVPAPEVPSLKLAPITLLPEPTKPPVAATERYPNLLALTDEDVRSMIRPIDLPRAAPAANTPPGSKLDPRLATPELRDGMRMTYFTTPRGVHTKQIEDLFRANGYGMERLKTFETTEGLQQWQRWYRNHASQRQARQQAHEQPNPQYDRDVDTAATARAMPSGMLRSLLREWQHGREHFLTTKQINAVAAVFATLNGGGNRWGQAYRDFFDPKKRAQAELLNVAPDIWFSNLPSSRSTKAPTLRYPFEDQMPRLLQPPDVRISDAGLRTLTPSAHERAPAPQSGIAQVLNTVLEPKNPYLNLLVNASPLGQGHKFADTVINLPGTMKNLALAGYDALTREYPADPILLRNIRESAQRHGFTERELWEAIRHPYLPSVSNPPLAQLTHLGDPDWKPATDPYSPAVRAAVDEAYRNTANEKNYAQTSMAPAVTSDQLAGMTPAERRQRLALVQQQANASSEGAQADFAERKADVGMAYSQAGANTLSGGALDVEKAFSPVYGPVSDQGLKNTAEVLLNLAMIPVGNVAQAKMLESLGALKGAKAAGQWGRTVQAELEDGTQITGALLRSPNGTARVLPPNGKPVSVIPESVKVLDPPVPTASNLATGTPAETVAQRPALTRGVRVQVQMEDGTQASGTVLRTPAGKARVQLDSGSTVVVERALVEPLETASGAPGLAVQTPTNTPTPPPRSLLKPGEAYLDDTNRIVPRQDAEQALAAIPRDAFTKVGPLAHEDHVNLAAIGGYYLEGGMDFDAWKGRMLAQFGPEAEPHLQGLWDLVKTIQKNGPASSGQPLFALAGSPDFQVIRQLGNYHAVVFRNRLTYVRDGLMNLDPYSKVGRNNLRRMQRGKCPKGADGKAIELHHLDQKNDSPILMLGLDEHRGKGNTKVYHHQPNTVKSQIDRRQWDTFRKALWKDYRASRLARNIKIGRSQRP
ncbi:MAG: HNH/ENDO VII family nuclease [Armatimonadota bacterium]